MNISYYDFQNLTDRQTQYELVLTHGRIISERIVSQSRYVLYEISNFSVELIYDNMHNKIIGMNLFEKHSSYR